MTAERPANARTEFRGLPDDLLPAVLDELRWAASRALRRRGTRMPLQTTDVVHEAWMRVSDSMCQRHFSKNSFRALAAAVIRSVLVDHARREMAQKRSGKNVKTILIAHADAEPTCESALEPMEVLALHEALEGLAVEKPRAAEVVQLRFFSGMSLLEIAEHLCCSRRTIDHDWQFAKAWLFR